MACKHFLFLYFEFKFRKELIKKKKVHHSIIYFYEAHYQLLYPANIERESQKVCFVERQRTSRNVQIN